ncbi:MAG: TPM domain-containing protein [Pseudobdellovibrionaceae bacterium]
MEAGKKWPTWAESFISEEEAQKVSEAVTKIETKTSGEVVPMIVQRSSMTGHLPYMITLIFLVVLLVFEVPHMDFFVAWNATWLLFLVSALCLLVSFPISRLHWVQRLLIPKKDQSFEVEERALLEFYQSGIPGTRERTGVLIFVSLMERKAVVLADESITKKLPQETWAQICQDMVEGIKKGKTAEGLVQAIQRSGELLAQHFPHGSENDNELSNHLILKE